MLVEEVTKTRLFRLGAAAGVVLTLFGPQASFLKVRLA
jgi:hypothetical protein